MRVRVVILPFAVSKVFPNFCVKVLRWLTVSSRGSKRFEYPYTTVSLSRGDSNDAEGQNLRFKRASVVNGPETSNAFRSSMETGISLVFSPTAHAASGIPLTQNREQIAGIFGMTLPKVFPSIANPFRDSLRSVSTSASFLRR